MLLLSYTAATCAMCAAALYLFLRLRPLVTTASMLLISLLLVYGPAVLSFTLSSGEHAFLLRLLGMHVMPRFALPPIREKVPDIDAVIVAVNFAVAVMYLGIMAGIELVNRLVPARAAAAEAAVRGWDAQPLHDELHDHRLLLAAIVVLFLFMITISISEHHVRTIQDFFAIKADDAARNLFRAKFGGSPNYAYRVVLGAVAPMFVIWGLLAGWVKRSWPLLLATTLLLLVTMLGKMENLARAPEAFFLIQLLLAALLMLTNRLSGRTLLLGAAVVAVVIYATTRLVISEDQSILEVAYARVFEVENETLLQNFAVFPHLHPFMWGTNIRPIAILMGVPYVPSFSLVAMTWTGDPNVTAPTLFIADAWADFAYAGVFVYSIVAGLICRAIDLSFLAKGKSVAAIAVLGATFWGVLTLITTALNIALFSGGLLLAPVLAAMLLAATRFVSRTAKAS
ncbi:MAG TPA: hypothetical protein VKR55_13725 [Bradyrhizobium sp.]|uniref:hypothetical protein n=1 Tax=Bradyrhizobium sp. TaxID=376 RepID=UPI002BCC4D2A|nr:hypothetical protein [Bradyrhizobium sp.]HLZ03192.1 hypothetical protein [Bradyrhizobium sp.]